MLPPGSSVDTDREMFELSSDLSTQAIAAGPIQAAIAAVIPMCPLAVFANANGRAEKAPQPSVVRQSKHWSDGLPGSTYASVLSLPDLENAPEVVPHANSAALPSVPVVEVPQVNSAALPTPSPCVTSAPTNMVAQISQVPSPPATRAATDKKAALAVMQYSDTLTANAENIAEVVKVLQMGATVVPQEGVSLAPQYTAALAIAEQLMKDLLIQKASLEDNEMSLTSGGTATNVLQTLGEEAALLEASPSSSNCANGQKPPAASKVTSGRINRHDKGAMVVPSIPKRVRK